jgi:hypothetical protein
MDVKKEKCSQPTSKRKKHEKINKSSITPLINEGIAVKSSWLCCCCIIMTTFSSLATFSTLQFFSVDCRLFLRLYVQLPSQRHIYPSDYDVHIKED